MKYSSTQRITDKQVYVNSTESYDGTEAAPDIYISHKSHILNQI